MRGVPVLDDDGGIREWVGIGTDVTAHKQAEAALRASEELRRTVVANAPIVLFAVDRDGIFTLSEGRGLAAAGIQPDQHVGQSYVALYGHLHDSVAALRRALAGEAATTVERYKGLIFETQWMPTRDADGTVTGAIPRGSQPPRIAPRANGHIVWRRWSVGGQRATSIIRAHPPSCTRGAPRARRLSRGLGDASPTP